MNIHSIAYDQIRAAYQRVFGRSATACEIAILAGISWHEAGYGTHWKGEGVGSFNMGAITAGSDWTGDTFSYEDSRPEGRVDVKYVTRFRKYPNSDAGFEDLVRTVFISNARARVRTAALSCNTLEVARGLYETSYFKGLAKNTPSERIAAYASAIEGGIKAAGIVPLIGFNRGKSILPWVILLGVAGLFWATLRSSPRPNDSTRRASPKLLARRVGA